MRHASDLAVMLPYNSRTFVAIAPGAAWGWQEHLLADIANTFRRFINNKNPLILPPESRKVPENPVYSEVEYQRMLNKSRKEVADV